MSGEQEATERRREETTQSTRIVHSSLMNFDDDGEPLHAGPTQEELNQAVRRREAAENRCKRAEDEAERQRKHAQRCEEDRRRVLQELDNWRRSEHAPGADQAQADAQKWKAEANRLHLEAERAKDDLAGLKADGASKAAERRQLSTELELRDKELKQLRDQLLKRSKELAELEESSQERAAIARRTDKALSALRRETDALKEQGSCGHAKHQILVAELAEAREQKAALQVLSLIHI
eukprot:TRINITY_DN8522_c0_g1_i1.p1 TRINITY_DN8522_c0_g1~~TRINITY_DN8522_c0_g1_i1.p1  ORF type:complete len:237 (-),score=76.78 TRINITY_DN8522_c0_g1_i1:58-768(-)